MKIKKNCDKIVIFVIFIVSIRLLSLGAPFWYVFTLSVALSLSMMHAKHYLRRKWRDRGWKEHKAETNCIRVWGRDARSIWSRHVLCPYLMWPSQKIYCDHIWPWPTHHYRHTTCIWLCSYQRLDKIRRK